MPYNNLTDRSEVAGLIPEQVSRDMLSNVATQGSAALQLFKRVPVGANQVRFPVLSALPMAYWVTGDTGLKQTTEMAWDNKFLNVEELAVIVPFPENVVDDMQSGGAGIDVWAEVQTSVEEAIARAFDAAVFFGINAPASFPVDVTDAAAAAGNTYAQGATAAEGGVQDDLDAAIGLVEADGYDPTGIVAARSLRGLLRRARDSQGRRLDGISGDMTQYMGLDVAYTMRGMFPNAASPAVNPRAFVGDWSQFVVGVRQDIRFKLLDQAVIQDGAGAIVYNLAQQDMVAMRLTFRAGWQVSAGISYDQPVAANRYPAATMTYVN